MCIRDSYVYGLVAAIRDDEMAVEERVAGLGAISQRAEFADWVRHHAGDDVVGASPRAALQGLRLPDRVTGWRLTDEELIIDARNLCQAGMGSTRLLPGWPAPSPVTSFGRSPSYCRPSGSCRASSPSVSRGWLPSRARGPAVSIS